MSLKAGKEALLRKRYTEAIAILQEYCQDHPNHSEKDYIQAQMWISSAYQRSGRADKAILICEQLKQSPDPQLQAWSKKSLISLRQQLENTSDIPEINTNVTSIIQSRPNRYHKKKVTLSLNQAAKFTYACVASMTVIAVIALVLMAVLWIISLITLRITTAWFNVALSGTAITSILLFFMSPWLIDIIHKQFYRTQWITLADIDQKSPESAEIIEHFCETRNIDVPKLGWIEDDNPVAFIYGVLPNSTRLVVSRGLFLNLDDDEIAAVYAQQLGRIANWSFIIITFASIPVQITYLIYVLLSRLSFKIKRAKNGMKLVAAIAYLVHNLSNYLLVSLTRTSSTLCDHFASESTGNPNALSRALTKTARAIAVQNQLGQPSSRLLESTRVFSFYDYKTVTTVGIAFEILHSAQSQQNLYKVFLWELFNPWHRWIEFHSTHSLIGNRIKALTNYSRQLGLTDEYEFTRLLNEGKSLKYKILFKNFGRDLLIEISPYFGIMLGLLIANWLYWLYNNWLPLSLALIGLGIGLMLQGSLRFPDYRRVTDTDLVSLLIDPYASTLSSKPVQIPGELIGYGNAKSQALSYDLKLADQAGVIYLNYLPSLKTLFKNPLVIGQQLESLIDESVVATGWFRRAELPVIDLSSLQPILQNNRANIRLLKSDHQTWNNILSSAIVLVGLLILIGTSLF